MKKRNTRRGFTLIELLVVVLITGILAAVALPQYRKVVVKSYVVQQLTIFNAYRKAIDFWVYEHGWPNEMYYGFTGDKTCSREERVLNKSLIVEFSTETYGCHDELDNTLINAYIKPNVALIAARPLKNRIKASGLNGCQANFQRQRGAEEWNLAQIVNVQTEKTATETECVDFTKIMCQYWATEGTGLGRSVSITQCARVGISLTLSE